MLTSSLDLLFGTPKKIEFLDIKFDFELNPEHFIEWLKAEEQEVIGYYKIDICSMCEYSCLYVAMILHGKKLKGELKVIYGKFGFHEHYWLEYTYEKEKYYIDLTLQQFSSDAPRLAISKADNERVNGSYSTISAGQSIKNYIKEKRGFMFYTNPHTMISPIKNEYKLRDLSYALDDFNEFL